jgi:metal-responsive CopG/Arc/MetJ family transcriptional regulator
MISKLRDIRKKTGISVSEIIREAVRRLLIECENTGSINLKIQ